MKECRYYVYLVNNEGPKTYGICTDDYRVDDWTDNRDNATWFDQNGAHDFMDHYKGDTSISIGSEMVNVEDPNTEYTKSMMEEFIKATPKIRVAYEEFVKENTLTWFDWTRHKMSESTSEAHKVYGFEVGCNRFARELNRRLSDQHSPDSISSLDLAKVRNVITKMGIDLSNTD